jgi:hypothetical protein
MAAGPPGTEVDGAAGSDGGANDGYDGVADAAAAAAAAGADTAVYDPSADHLLQDAQAAAAAAAAAGRELMQGDHEMHDVGQQAGALSVSLASPAGTKLILYLGGGGKGVRG